MNSGCVDVNGSALGWRGVGGVLSKADSVGMSLAGWSTFIFLSPCNRL